MHDMARALARRFKLLGKSRYLFNPVVGAPRRFIPAEFDHLCIPMFRYVYDVLNGSTDHYGSLPDDAVRLVLPPSGTPQ